MTDQLPSGTEGKIILAAIDCIEKYGFQGATNRKIAAAANVNLAAINYYFRSKENLITRCMEVTLDNAFGWEGLSSSLSGTPEERCAAIFDELIQGGLNYPGLTRAHFYKLASEGKYDALLIEKLNGFIENLADDLAAHGARLDLEELRLACIQIASSVLMMILTPQLFEQKFGLNLRDPAIRKKFVQRLVNRLLS